MSAPMFFGAKSSIFRKATDLRLRTTRHERILWEKLRASRMGFRFKRQHPISHFISDFYCHKAKLVIEIDGRSHESQIEYDQNRTLVIEEFGLNVIRFTNQEIDDNIDSVVETIKRYLAHPQSKI
jgi:very-short-patch-repair endonuclease